MTDNADLTRITMKARARANVRRRRSRRIASWGVIGLCLAILGGSMPSVVAQANAQGSRANDAYRPPADQQYETASPQQPSYGAPAQGYGGAPTPADRNPGPGGYGQNTYGQPQTYSPPAAYGNQGGNQGGAYGHAPPREPANGNQPAYGNQTYGANQVYGAGERSSDAYQPPRQDGYGQPYSPPPVDQGQGPGPRESYRTEQGRPTRGYYTEGEITEKGRGFFGSITQGLASAIEYTYQKAGRPNGYILGEDGGGAFFAGLRYGEGMLFTKDAGDHKVFWQGPSLGYDIGGEGSKVMVLVYNMADPGDIYHRFGGVEGSAYLVGGVSVQFQKSDDVTLAVIRSGVGLRLGANVGYLKYTRSPTWNPF